MDCRAVFLNWIFWYVPMTGWQLKATWRGWQFPLTIVSWKWKRFLTSDTQTCRASRMERLAQQHHGWKSTDSPSLPQVNCLLGRHLVPSEFVSVGVCRSFFGELDLSSQSVWVLLQTQWPASPGPEPCPSLWMCQRPEPPFTVDSVMSQTSLSWESLVGSFFDSWVNNRPPVPNGAGKMASQMGIVCFSWKYDPSVGASLTGCAMATALSVGYTTPWDKDGYFPKKEAQFRLTIEEAPTCYSGPFVCPVCSLTSDRDTMTYWPISHSEHQHSELGY
jgi:hypothetical protein